MNDFDYIFKNKSVCFDRLEPFGFAEDENGRYRYQQPVINGQFEFSVFVSPNGETSSELRDTDTGDLYTLHLSAEAAGSFVGQIRTECGAILQNIADACFVTDVFKSRQAKMLLDYIRQKYGDKPEFLWEKFPDNAVIRRQDNKKWYAAFLTVAAHRPGLNNPESAEILDLRGRPEEIEKTVDGEKIFPGYHMNKKNWYTVFLDGRLADDDICKRLDESFALAKKINRRNLKK